MHWIALSNVGFAPENSEPLADPLAALSWRALQFTPHVVRIEEAVLVEISASERLFGGFTALLERLLEPSGVQFPIAFAQGDTALVALGRLRSNLPEARPDALPLSALSAARSHLPTLQRLGCLNWGQLRALPRAGVARRFGAELLLALDYAYGTRAPAYCWEILPPVFDVSLELSAAVESAAALLFGARRLLGQLQVWLRARQLGLMAMELVWQLDARRSNATHIDTHHDGSGYGKLLLRTAEATQDMAHLQRLLAERLSGVQLPAPVLYLRLLSCETQQFVGQTRSLLAQTHTQKSTQGQGESRHQMLERLQARLGADKVLCVTTRSDHLAERMQLWRPWSATPAKCSALPLAQGVLYPTWLLAQPQPLVAQCGRPQYHGTLTLLLGPQRLETGWLEDEAVLRDYFVARSVQAGLLWIYRARLKQHRMRWFLHGFFA